ncbi:MAG: hypothetical protein JF614_17540 [Acidobacteria bacterium]|nr:hypothetical protein [Acidobacteriota bacterium]
MKRLVAIFGEGIPGWSEDRQAWREAPQARDGSPQARPLLRKPDESRRNLAARDLKAASRRLEASGPCDDLRMSSQSLEAFLIDEEICLRSCGDPEKSREDSRERMVPD